MQKESDMHESVCQSVEKADEKILDDFFTFEEKGSRSKAAVVLAEMEMYLAETSRDLISLAIFPTMKSLFLCYNTGLSSRGPEECMFSLSDQILTLRRNRLSDENFEELLLRASRNKYDRS